MVLLRIVCSARVHSAGIVLIVMAMLILSGCAVQRPTSGSSPDAKRHMVVAAHPEAVKAGLSTLRAGGSAVDAAIAVQLVLTLVEPQSSGIGGGAFLLHARGADRLVEAYDGRETAPLAATPELFLHKSGDTASQPMKFFDALVGGLAVGAPGAVRMMALAHRDHGTLPWAELFQPAIRLATDGFELSPRLFASLARDRFLKKQPVASLYFYLPDGSPKPVGTRLRNLPLADTLRRIAAGGADVFYRGPIADDIVRTVRTAKPRAGILDAEDLKSYKAKKRLPLCRAYRAYRVCTMPPPTSGGLALLQILGLLERFDLSRQPPGSPGFVHLVSEASRLAFADRDFYAADPDFIDVPVGPLLDPAYLENRARMITGPTSMGKAAPGRPVADRPVPAAAVSPERPSTSHVSIVDGAGNAVSMTTSIENRFGSRLMVRGFMLNNQLTDFSFRPGSGDSPVANRVEGGKRPRSSMTPALVFDRDGALRYVLGSPGGPLIIGFVAQTLLAMVDGGLDPQDAVALPHHINMNGVTILERGTELIGLAVELSAMGHRVVQRRLTSGLHVIEVRPDGLTGGADPRREGEARGD